MEKRSNTRIVFDVTAIVKYHKKTIQCKVINLSMTGILLQTDANIPKNEKMKINIMMEGSTSKLTISLDGVVVRNGKSEIAAEFKSIDLDSFIHLKNIIVYNEGDEEKIMKEFYGSVKSAHQAL